MVSTTETDQPSDAPTKSDVEPLTFYDSMATKLEEVFGQPPPPLEIRFSNLSVSCKVTTVESPQQEGSTASSELPTVWNVLKHAAVDLVSKRKTETLEILKSVSGILRPGTMTLVLGQPGSGKSTLLKALSGRLRADVHVSGDITYNGETQRHLAKRLPQLAAFVPQQDRHFPPLTVQETLSFAHIFSSSSKRDLTHRAQSVVGKEYHRDALSSALDILEQFPEVVKALFGLQSCWDTIVGDGMLRGVSGGEKKRVTTAEMSQGLHQACFLDEISTGLDSAAIFDIITSLRAIALRMNRTMVVSLLQPPPNVFELFDDVILLNEGEVMYYGPRERVVDYFGGLGLVCPPSRDVADFLLDLGTRQQRAYESPSTGRQPPRQAQDFAACFTSSDLHLDALTRLKAPSDPTQLKMGKRYVASIPEFQRSLWVNAYTLLQRQLLLLMRDVNMLGSRVVLLLIAAIIFSTNFMNVKPTDVSTMMGAIFMSTMFPVFEQTSQLSLFVGMRDIFYKQRAANFFQSSAYVLANALSQIPLALPESCVYGAFMYWIVGLEASAGRFILYELIIFLNVMAAVMVFFLVAAVAPNIYILSPAALMALHITIVFSGFVVTHSQIPDYLVWLYWMNPTSWAFRALAINQYRSPTFDVCTYDGVDYCSEFGCTMGEYYLSTYDISTGEEWIVWGIVYIVGLIIALMVLSYLALEYKRYESDVGASRAKPQDVNDDGGSYQLAATPKQRSGIQTTPPSHPSDTPRAIDVYNHIPVVPVTVAFKDLWYSVPNPSEPKATLDLLKGISGVAYPGTITALMGSSGAGKTTLLDVIAGRKNTGTVRGKIMLNGHEATELAIRRCTGYCEQTDIHSETATFYEALMFSAFLRQSSEVPESAKIASVNEIVELLGLQDIADRMVGGSSLEQMKRLTIGVELAAQPSVLFLDEPTSGLDARFAKMIMDGIRKVANSGRTVICTIHQPSYKVFSVFDNLLLLKRGGETVFFGNLGQDCQNLVDYFEAIPGVEPLPEGYNPATWMLECIGAGVNNPSNFGDDVDFVQCFNKSTLKSKLDLALQEEGVGLPSTHVEALTFRRKRAASSMVQVTFLVQRFFRMYWRSPGQILSILGVAIACILMLGLVSTGLSSTSYQGVCSGLGIIFMSFQFQGFVSFNTAIPFAFSDRAAFYRERSSQTYNTLWYFVAESLVEVPYVFVKGLIIAVLIFLFMGITGTEKFILFWFATSLSILIDAYTGHVLAFALPNIVIASLAGSVVTTTFFVFVGFNPPGGAIPDGYQWLYTITPQRYALGTLGALVYGDCSTTPEYNSATGSFVNVGPEDGCQPLYDTPISVGNVTVKKMLEVVYDIHHDDIATNFAAQLIFVVVFRFLALLAMYFLNHQKR